jgi:hypothetical protein
MRIESQHAEHEPDPDGRAGGNANPQIALTPDELQEVLRSAISRQSGSYEPREQLSTLEEAIEIARQAGVEEEHVVRAAADLQQHRLRGVKRAVARSRRAMQLVLYVPLALGMSLFGLFLGLPWWLALFFWLPLAWLGWRVTQPVTDAEADRIELPPEAGVCRVCGAPAHSPRATFCRAHQYRAPGQPE